MRSKMSLFSFILADLFCGFVACNVYEWNPFRDRSHVSALVLARGGSKGIRLKNLALVRGRTLLSRSIEVVRATKGFDSIWVSTDHGLIHEEAEKHDGVNVHWRSAESAKDETPSLFAIQEFLTVHKEIEAVALIQCTSPFARSEFLSQALHKFFAHGKECVFSVTRSYKLRWSERFDGVNPLNFHPERRPRRQDWNGELVENGMFYLATRKLILSGLLQSNSCSVIKIPEKYCYEIDSYWNLAVANEIFKLQEE